jgi:hypothetical protein
MQQHCTWVLSCCGALQLRSQALQRRPSSSCSDPLPPSPAPSLHYTLRASYHCHAVIRPLSPLESCLCICICSLNLTSLVSCAGAQRCVMANTLVHR